MLGGRGLAPDLRSRYHQIRLLFKAARYHSDGDGLEDLGSRADV
jgi:hypothetical protein